MNARERRIAAKLDRAGQALQQGDCAAAQRICRDILSRAPDCLPALNLGAIAAHQGGDAAAAALLLERAVAAHPDDGEAYYNFGVIHQSRGEIERAAAWFADAARRSPGFADAHYNHATALMELGQAQAAADAYRRCIDAQPDHAAAYSGLGFVLRELQRYGDAALAYEAGLARNPRDARARSGLGVALQAQGLLPEAQAAFERAAAIDPDYPEAAVNLADVLIVQGAAPAALAACDRYLARYPGDAGVLAAKSIALGECGDAAARGRLVDFDRLLERSFPAAPPDYSDIGEFCTALSAHIAGHATLTEAPTSHATRDGKHTGELLGDGVAPIRGFEAMLHCAIANYRARLPGDPDHPFIAHQPDRYRLAAWSIVLEGQGHQEPHIHPSAWLSGVFYAQVPEFIRGDDASQAGWIAFGDPGAEFHSTAVPATRAIRPERGLLVLFPSYFFHRTIPFRESGTRISVAFDVMPA